VATGTSRLKSVRPSKDIKRVKNFGPMGRNTPKLGELSDFNNREEIGGKDREEEGRQLPCGIVAGMSTSS